MNRAASITWEWQSADDVDDAIDEWRARRRLRACVHARGGHFEHLQ